MAKKKRQLPDALKANADKLKRGESIGGKKKSPAKKSTRKRK
jgi:hypothetical protein